MPRHIIISAAGAARKSEPMTLTPSKLANIANLEQKLGFYLSGLLVCVIAAQLAWLSWDILDVLTRTTALPPATDISRNDANKQRVDMLAVAERHLFGAAPAETAASVETIDAPETRLNLKLRGILAADDPEFSRAIIAAGNGEHIYSVGGSIPGGATVHAVLRDRVLIRRGGQLEALTLPKQLADTGIGISSDSTTDEPISFVAPDITAATDIPGLLNNPEALSELVRYSPIMEDGQLKGFRIFPGRDRQKFSGLGLRPGDIVTAVNGTTLNDPSQAAAILEELNSASSVTVTVERGGVTEDITINAGQ